MTNSFVKYETYKDDNGYINIEINADIYYEDREMYLLTSKIGPNWRNSAADFTTGEEDDIKWERRMHTYVDTILNRMGWTRERNVTLLIMQTNFYPGQYGHEPTGYRSFLIEITTNKRSLPPARNRLPF